MKKITYLFLFLFCSSIAQEAEDSVKIQECYAPFDNFFVNPTQHQLFENPAAAGLYKTNNIHLSGMSQEFNTPWYTHAYQASYDGQMGKSKKWGVGSLYFKRNDADVFVTSGLGLYLSRLMQYKSHQITIGASLFYEQLSFDWSQATFGDMIDPRRGFIYQSNSTTRGGTGSRLDYDLGLIYQFRDKLRIGVALNSLSRGDMSVLSRDEIGFPTILLANLSYEFAINPDLKIIPILRYKHYSVFNEIESKVMLTLANRYMFSMGYNNNKRASAMLGYNLKNKLIGMIEFNHGLYPGIGDFIYHTPTISGKLLYRFNLKK